MEPVYQYSLSWFKSLFQMTLSKAEKNPDLEKRVAILNAHFRYALYKNVNRSLLEKDKVIFSFLLCTDIMDGARDLDHSMLRFILTGGVEMAETKEENLNEEWLTQKQWVSVARLAKFPSFNGLLDSFKPGPDYAGDKWKSVCYSTSPHKEILPQPWEERASSFMRLLLVRSLRPDKLLPSLKDFVAERLGEKFVKPPPFDLKDCYEDSSSSIPLIFILSPGSDPMTTVLKFADSLRKRVNSVSLGQGQGPVAESLMERGKREGSWVVLQNCHLAPSWMTAFEKFFEESDPTKMNSSYRLFCTTYPTPIFPVAILQASVKMTNEPPKGIRANLMRSYMGDPIADVSFFEGLKGLKGDNFHFLLFGLCMFHAVVQERVFFGPLGWNIPYEFNESDLRISAQQLEMFISEQKEIPFEALVYTVGECNYGGRVTDDNDRQTLRFLLKRFYCTDVLHPGHEFLEDSKVFVVPNATLRKEFIDFINDLPHEDTNPGILGFHENASFTKNNNEALEFCSAMMLTMTGSGGSANASADDKTVDETAENIIGRIPPTYDLEAAQIKFPTKRDESMNTVLVQELSRFNILNDLIRESLVNVRKALKGEVLMSPAVENLFQEVLFGKVPSIWLTKSYPSLKPLAGYFSDFLKRIDFLEKWVKSNKPAVFWISGFFFTQAFLTGAKQNYARRNTIPIDDAVFNFQMMKGLSFRSPPEEGIYISGLFIEAARWDDKEGSLVESLPGELVSQAPIIWLKPTTSDKEDHFPFKCPVYKTSERRGQLSTTGHSTNFVMNIRVPTERSQSHWKQRGAAMLTQLDD